MEDKSVNDRRTLKQREKDIECLECALTELKETMQLEFGNKNRDYESLRITYDKVC